MTTAVICIFIVGYIMIAMENVTKVNKSAVALLMAVLCWTLLAYTAGIGGSLLIIGSTAGVVVMGLQTII